MPELTADYISGVKFKIDVRGHTLVTDQQVKNNGENAGPSPVEFFVASLAGCIGYFAVTFLRRHEIDFNILKIYSSWEYAKNPERVSRIDVKVTTDAKVPEELKERMHSVMEGCTVHNTIKIKPELSISLQS